MGIPHELISLSNYYGNRSDYVIAGGGNTSYKSGDELWIKASGVSLSGIDDSGFVCLSRKKLGKVAVSDYSTDRAEREAGVKKDIVSAIISGTGKRPSVETPLHNLFEYSYIVHTHPYTVNALLCSMKAEQYTRELFGNEILFIEYTNPGYTLFKKTESEVNKYTRNYGKQPAVVFLQNHGMIVCGDNAGEIQDLSERITGKVKSRFKMKLPSPGLSGPEADIGEKLDEINSYLQDRGHTSVFNNSELIRIFTPDENEFKRVSRPLTPDNIVYCRSKYLFAGDETESLINEIQSFETDNGYLPVIVGLKQTGLLSVGPDSKSASRSMEVFQDMMKVSFLSVNFGGPKFLNKSQIDFIDHWEAEDYRRNI